MRRGSVSDRPDDLIEGEVVDTGRSSRQSGPRGDPRYWRGGQWPPRPPHRGTDPLVWVVRGVVGLAVLVGIWLVLDHFFPLADESAELADSSVELATPAPPAVSQAPPALAPQPTAASAGAAAPVAAASTATTEQRPADPAVAPPTDTPITAGAAQPPPALVETTTTESPVTNEPAPSEPTSPSAGSPSEPAARAEPTAAAIRPIPPPPATAAPPPAQRAAPPAATARPAPPVAVQPANAGPAANAAGSAGPLSLRASVSPANPLSENAVLTVTANVTANGAPVSGAACLATIYFRTATVRQPEGGAVTTGPNGTASFRIDAIGATYDRAVPVDVTCNARGSSVTARTGFTPTRRR